MEVVAWSNIGYSSDDAPRNAHHPLSSHFRRGDDDSLPRSLEIFQGALLYTRSRARARTLHARFRDVRTKRTSESLPVFKFFNIMSNVKKERKKEREENGKRARVDERTDSRKDGRRSRSSVGGIFMLKLGDLSRKRHLHNPAKDFDGLAAQLPRYITRWRARYEMADSSPLNAT